MEDRHDAAWSPSHDRGGRKRAVAKGLLLLEIRRPDVAPELRHVEDDLVLADRKIERRQADAADRALALVKVLQRVRGADGFLGGGLERLCPEAARAVT